MARAAKPVSNRPASLPRAAARGVDKIDERRVNVTGSPALTKRLQQRFAKGDRRAVRRGQAIAMLALLSLTAAAIWVVQHRSSPVVEAAMLLPRLATGEPAPATVQREQRAALAAAAVKAAAEKAAGAAKAAAQVKAAGSDGERLIAIAPDQAVRDGLRQAAAEPRGVAVPAKPAEPAPSGPGLAAIEQARAEVRFEIERAKAELAAAVAAIPARPAAAPAGAPEGASEVAKKTARLDNGGEAQTVGQTAAAPAPAPRPCVRDLEIAAQTLLISFEVNSAVVSAVQVEQLKRFAGLARGCSAAAIEVAGHTDLKGAQERNFGLSWQRAESVMGVLRGAGIEPTRMTPIGYGPRKPLSPAPDAAADNAVDRRVELTVR